MTRSHAFIAFSKLIFTDTKFLLKELLKYVSEADKRIYIQKKMELTNGLPFVDLKELVPDLNETLENFTFLDGTSQTIDIAFLKALCRQFDKCEYLEIGSWRGESLFNISPVIHSGVSVSFSSDEVMKRFNNKPMADSIKFFSNTLPNIKHVEADSLTFDFNSLNQKFDVIFVDGDHTYEGVKSDTSNAFKLLKNESSVIVFHDCGFSNEDIRYEVVAGVIDGTPDDKRKFLYRVSNTLCGIYTTRKINPMPKTIPQLPNKVFKVRIESNLLAS